MDVLRSVTKKKAATLTRADEILEYMDDAIKYPNDYPEFSRNIKFLNGLDKDEKSIVHFLYGSPDKKHKHNWEKIIPGWKEMNDTERWENVKRLTAYVMEYGEKSQCIQVSRRGGEVFKRIKSINGYNVEVTFESLDGVDSISNSFVRLWG